MVTIAEWFLRLSLAAAFLSAVADRFGLWGPPGAANVAWGTWPAFIDYVGTLNWFAPVWLHPALGWIATIAEVVIACGLLAGWKLRCFAAASGVLLMGFALTMALARGIKAPLDFSVFTAAAASFLLAVVTRTGVRSTLPPLSAQDRRTE